jgi:hypothetical protein
MKILCQNQFTFPRDVFYCTCLNGDWGPSPHWVKSVGKSTLYHPPCVVNSNFGCNKVVWHDTFNYRSFYYYYNYMFRLLLFAIIRLLVGLLRYKLRLNHNGLWPPHYPTHPHSRESSPIQPNPYNITYVDVSATIVRHHQVAYRFT